MNPDDVQAKFFKFVIEEYERETEIIRTKKAKQAKDAEMKRIQERKDSLERIKQFFKGFEFD